MSLPRRRAGGSQRSRRRWRASRPGPKSSSRGSAPCALRLAPCALSLAPCALRLAPPAERGGRRRAEQLGTMHQRAAEADGFHRSMQDTLRFQTARGDRCPRQARLCGRYLAGPPPDAGRAPARPCACGPRRAGAACPAPDCACGAPGGKSLQQQQQQQQQQLDSGVNGSNGAEAALLSSSAGAPASPPIRPPPGRPTSLRSAASAVTGALRLGGPVPTRRRPSLPY